MQRNNTKKTRSKQPSTRSKLYKRAKTPSKRSKFAPKRVYKKKSKLSPTLTPKKASMLDYIGLLIPIAFIAILWGAK